MKLSIASILAFIIIILASATLILAQSDGRRLVAEIPFEFNVKDKQFPAGKFEFFRPSEASAPWMLVVRSIGMPKTLSATVMTEEAGILRRSDNPTISFNQYGGSLYLSSILHKQAGIRLRIVRSAKEIEIAEKMSPNVRKVSLTPQRN